MTKVILKFKNSSNKSRNDIAPIIHTLPPKYKAGHTADKMCTDMLIGKGKREHVIEMSPECAKKYASILVAKIPGLNVRIADDEEDKQR